MEHSVEGQGGDGSVPASSHTSPGHQSPSASPHPSLNMNSNSDSPHSSNSNLVLYLGCDSNEEEEEDVEELRNFKEDSEEQLLPYSLQELKFSNKFTLTPTLTRKEKESSKNLCDLITPYHAFSKSTDCPERPSKAHRTSTSQCESSTSCRLLFSAAAALVEDDSNDHQHNKLFTPPRLKTGAPSPTATSTKHLLFKGGDDNLPTPIYCPSSSSPLSSCSDCVACTSTDSSSSIHLSSPILSQFKPISQTIMSNPEGEQDQTPAVDQVLDPPMACEMPLQLQGGSVEDVMPQDTPKDAMKEDDNLKDAPPPPTIDKEDEGVLGAVFRPQNEHLEHSLAPSSTGSVHSNWTVISGISPLPSSDPKHRHHHHHHHHCHHTHHHHGHHRHHFGGRICNKSSEASDCGANLVTSTPIHQKPHVAKMVDVSAVTSSPEVFSNPRFIMSLELVSPEPRNGGRGEDSQEERDNVFPRVIPSWENLESCPASLSLPVPLQTASSLNTGVENTGLKRPRQCTDKESNDERNNINEEQMEQNIKKTRNTEELQSISSQRKKPTERRSRLCTKYVQGRPLSKAEARTLTSAHLNFSEKYLLGFEEVSCPRLSSTVDESLFRAVSMDSQPLSITLE